MAVIDSYPESNYTGISNFATGRLYGQSFSSDGEYILDRIDVYIRLQFSSATNTTINVYAHSGEYGVSSVPTGSPIATSNSTLVSNSTIELISFNFSGGNRVSLHANTKYCFAVNNQSASVTFAIGYDGTSPTHSGNLLYSLNNGSTWTAQNLNDLIFYVYGTPASTNNSNFLQLF